MKRLNIFHCVDCYWWFGPNWTGLDWSGKPLGLDQSLSLATGTDLLSVTSHTYLNAGKDDGEVGQCLTNQCHTHTLTVPALRE